VGGAELLGGGGQAGVLLALAPVRQQQRQAVGRLAQLRCGAGGVACMAAVDGERRGVLHGTRAGKRRGASFVPRRQLGLQLQDVVEEGGLSVHRHERRRRCGHHDRRHQQARRPLESGSGEGA
jgi:hypothetical protein